MDVIKFVTDDGRCPFEEWRETLADKDTLRRVRVRISRLRDGNFGDTRSVGKGVHELRLMFGAGNRIYYGRVGSTVVLLLCGGDKSSQSVDVSRAQEFWADFEEDPDGHQVQDPHDPV